MLRVAVVGNGYVGEATVDALRGTLSTQKGDQIKISAVWVFDKDPERGLSMDEFRPEQFDIVFVCLPTYANDVRGVRQGLDDSVIGPLAEKISDETICVICSTVDTDFVNDHNSAIVYFPERINPTGRNALGAEYKQPRERVIGCECKETLVKAIAMIEKMMPRFDLTVAETPQAAVLSKLIENTYRLVNIALIDNLAAYYPDDILEAIDLAKTKPFGFEAFYPGWGAGGPCIAEDPLFLSQYSEGLPSMVQAAVVANGATQIVLFSRILDETSPGEQLLFVGVGYKPGESGTHRSGPLYVADWLHAAGRKIWVVDPNIDLQKIRPHFAVPAYGDPPDMIVKGNATDASWQAACRTWPNARRFEPYE